MTPAAPLAAAARARRVDRQREHAEPEHPGEHRADDDVVGATAVAEQAEHDGRPSTSSTNSPSRGVDAERERAERAGERDVAERVAGEDLAAQHHEVADQPGQRRDRHAGEERVPHERVGEQVAEAGRRPRAAPVTPAPSRPSAHASRSLPPARGEQVHGERDRRDEEADRVRREVRDEQRQTRSTREPDPDGERERRAAAAAVQRLRRRGRDDQQGEHQQRPGDLADLGRGDPQQDQERHRQPAHRDAAGRGDVRVDGGEQQRPRDRGQDRRSVTAATTRSSHDLAAA